MNQKKTTIRNHLKKYQKQNKSEQEKVSIERLKMVSRNKIK
jgi:hypothetical protein